MNPSTMLRAFCDAVEQRNGKAFSDLFTEDGVYHDVFYGAFEGRTRIAELIDDWFYRTATDFRWDMHDPVSDGQTLYARYTFSYRSTLPEAQGARAMFEGVAIMRLRDGRIAEYHEVANTAPAFVDIKFAPERIARIVAKQGAALKARPEMKRHLVECRSLHVIASAAKQSILRHMRNDGLLRRFAPRNDGCDYGGGTVVIGLRCASAATVDVPIGPTSS
jgi:ketosteroid isomerase-like protein